MKTRNSRGEIIPGMAVIALWNLLKKLELTRGQKLNISKIDDYLVRHPMLRMTENTNVN